MVSVLEPKLTEAVEFLKHAVKKGEKAFLVLNQDRRF